MSKYNIYLKKIKMPMRVMRQGRKKNAKKWRKDKNTKVLERYVYFSYIFPLLLCLLHFSIARLRLRQNLEGFSGWKQPEKGVGRENRAKMVSFWPVLFKIKRTKTMPFWAFLKGPKRRCFGLKKKNKKIELLFTLCNSTLEKKREGEEGDRGSRRTCGSCRALCA